MPRSKYWYILSLTFSLVSLAWAAQAQTDTATQKPPHKRDSSAHQLCIGIDIAAPVANALYANRYEYDAEADYYLRNDFYLAIEGGWGGSNVNYSNLVYTTTNNFYRFGFNKAILPRDRWTDWDMMFFGLRAAFAPISRSPSSFTVVDSVWGNAQGSQKATHFNAIWAELTAGMRVELLKNFFAGWNVRGKILMNEKSFAVYAPLYIAGYGKGDKNTNFDFNVYISYAMRWKRKHYR